MSDTDLVVMPGQSVATALPIERVLSAIIKASTNPSVDVTKMRELLTLQKDLMAMQAEQQFTESFHRLSVDMPRIKRSGAVEYKGKEAFRFATWEAIDAAVRPLLQREGFSLSFDTAPRAGDGGGATVTGTLSHIGGHKRTASITLALDSSGGKNSIQAMGSTFSYGKRYCTTALLNIVTEGEDDDGVRGGARFITEEQAERLRGLMKATGRQEGPLLDSMFAGRIRSVEELEIGQGHDAVLNMLLQIQHRMNKGATP